MDEAIQMAIGNSPRLKGAALYADKAKAAKGENWDGGNLQIGYSWGQLDGLERSDNELTIEQSLGNLLTPYYKNALLKTQAAEGRQRMALIKKEITAEVKRAWYDCLAAAEQMRLCAAGDSMAQVLLRTAARKFETGEINRLEHSLLNTLAAEMRTQSLQARSAWQLALRRLTWVCRSEAQLTPAETSFGKIQIKETAAVSPERLQLLENAVQQKRDAIKVERSKFFPEIHNRFPSFRQSLFRCHKNIRNTFFEVTVPGILGRVPCQSAPIVRCGFANPQPNFCQIYAKFAH